MGRPNNIKKYYTTFKVLSKEELLKKINKLEQRIKDKAVRLAVRKKEHNDNDT